MKYLVTALIFLLFLSACANSEQNIMQDNQPSSQVSDDIKPTEFVRPQKWWVEELCEENIVGTWQSYYCVTAAYNELFVFRSDHTFTFYKSEYDDIERELSFWGTWSFENDRLILQKEYAERIEGGTLEEGLLIGTQEYVGGERVTEKIAPAEIIEVTLSQFIDQEGMTVDGYVFIADEIMYPSLYMNRVQYWRMADFDIPANLEE